jgi:EmrB/QacA subfamily drug resistance transporter
LNLPATRKYVSADGAFMTTLMTLEHAGDEAAEPGAANYVRRWWILGVLGVAQLMVILDGTIVNIALPTAQHDLHFSNADRQWIVTAYSLAFGSLLLLGGRIGDMVGRKRALIVGLAGFALASAAGGAAVNFTMLVIARTVQGAFGAILAPSVLAILTTTFASPDERGKAFGIYGAIAGAGGALGLLLGGILTSYASWRWTLFVNLFFAAIATAGALFWLARDDGVDTDPVDFPGLFLVAGGLFCLVFGFSHAETTAWRNPYTIGILVAGVILLVIFAYIEANTAHPLLPPRVVLNRTRGGSMLVGLLTAVGSFGVFLFLTYYLQTTLKFSPVRTGVAFLPMIIALASMAQVSNRVLLPLIGPRPMVPIGMLICGAAMLGLHSVGLHTSYFSHVLPYLVILGIGFGLSASPTFSTGTLGLAPKDAGVGSATLNSTQQVGGSIGTSLLNTLAASAASSYLAGRALTAGSFQAALLHSYTTAFLWSALVFVIGAAVAAAVLPSGNLATLAAMEGAPPLDAGQNKSDRVQIARVRIGCR